MSENSELKELKDSELKKAVGGLDVYSDENTITMYFSYSENPSVLLFSVKNYIDRQIGCILDTNASNTLQNLLDEMSNTGKTYLKINYVKNGELITDISVNTVM